MYNYNKREKTSNLLFKIVEYGIIAFGLNAFLPNSPISLKRSLIVLVMLIIIYLAALIITPEKET